MRERPAVLIQELYKTYRKGSSAVHALKGIDLEVAEGDFFALLGENGAGKTTIIGILCSLINKSAGQVRVFDYDLITQASLVKRQIGVVPQEFNFNIFERVGDIVCQQGGYYGMKAADIRTRSEKYLRKLDLWDKRKEQSKNLSGGMKRRLLIARALIHEPRLLILDEPTAGVDIEIRHSMWDFLRELNKQGKTIILTTHYLEEAEQLCRNVAIIHEGKIIVSSPMRDLLHQLRERVYLVETNNKISEDIKADFFQSERLDDNTLEICIDKDHSLNKLFQYLNEKKIEIISIEAKDKRLEKVFMEMTNSERH